MTLDHLQTVMHNMRPQDRIEFETIADQKDLDTWASNYVALPGFNWAVLNSARAPVACVGFREIAQGVAVAWFVATEAWKRHAKSTTRAFRIMSRNRIYRRIEAYVNPENVKAQQYVRWLGFQYEGNCRRRAANGSDLLQYAFTEG